MSSYVRRNPYNKRKYPYTNKRYTPYKKSYYKSKAAYTSYKGLPRNTFYGKPSSPYEYKYYVHAVNWASNHNGAVNTAEPAAAVNHWTAADFILAETVAAGDVYSTTQDYCARYFLQEIKQGTTNETRIGSKINLKYLDIRFFVKYVAGISEPQAVWLILDKSPNGGIPKVGDIFKNQEAYPAGPLGGTLTMKQPLNEGRFVFLKTWLIGNGNGSGIANGMQSKMCTYQAKCNYEIKYGAAFNSATSILTNNIFLIATAGTTGRNHVYCNVMMRYVDA